MYSLVVRTKKLEILLLTPLHSFFTKTEELLSRFRRASVSKTQTKMYIIEANNKAKPKEVKCILEGKSLVSS